MPQQAANLLNHREAVYRFKRNEESPASTLPAGLFTHFGSRLDSELKTTIHREPFTIHHQIGPCPIQLVVPIAVQSCRVIAAVRSIVKGCGKFSFPKLFIKGECIFMNLRVLAFQCYMSKVPAAVKCTLFDSF